MDSLILKLSIFFTIILLICGCSENKHIIVDRESKIPDDILKVTPGTDFYPPQLHSDEFKEPIPLPGPINTAGAEDSPFIPCCNENHFYFFFTPDVRIPVEQQITDNVTGIYFCELINGSWTEPERVFLNDPGSLSLDGCTFVLNDTMWFCSAREGYTGVHWFKAEYSDDEWTSWSNADYNVEFEVGELHIHANELYYHSSRDGGKGKNDIWVLEKIDGEWQNPMNVEVVNTEEDEGWPYISQNGTELWFNREYLGTPAIYRSKKEKGEWQQPELIISQFAGEPTLDSTGNIYFVHHFYDNGTMIEADIYISYRKL